MSCNGCRVLRKGCGEACILRPCLEWIDSAEAQANATVFAAKFFGRAALMGLISAVPENQRPALFQSLLHEACGRTVNPVGGAVGLLCSGNWRACQAAVETVLKGAELKRPTLQHSQRCDGKNSVMEERAQRKRCRNSSTEVVEKDFASTEVAGKDPKPRVHRITGGHYMDCKKIMSKGARLLNVLPNVMAQEPKTTAKAREELVGELEPRSAKQCKGVHVPNADGIGGGPLHGIVEERSPSTLSVCELSLSLSSPLRKEKDPLLVVTSPSTVSVTSEGSVSCLVPTPPVRERKLLHLRL